MVRLAALEARRRSLRVVLASFMPMAVRLEAAAMPLVAVRLEGLLGKQHTRVLEAARVALPARL